MVRFLRVVGWGGILRFEFKDVLFILGVVELVINFGWVFLKGGKDEEVGVLVVGINFNFFFGVFGVDLFVVSLFVGLGRYCDMLMVYCRIVCVCW